MGKTRREQGGAGGGGDRIGLWIAGPSGDARGPHHTTIKKGGDAVPHKIPHLNHGRGGGLVRGHLHVGGRVVVEVGGAAGRGHAADVVAQHKDEQQVGDHGDDGPRRKGLGRAAQVAGGGLGHGEGVVGHHEEERGHHRQDDHEAHLVGAAAGVVGHAQEDDGKELEEDGPPKERGGGT